MIWYANNELSLELYKLIHKSQVKPMGETLVPAAQNGRFHDF